MNSTTWDQLYKVMECGKEVKKKVQTAWIGWRRAVGVIYEKGVSTRMKGKVYKMLLRQGTLWR